MTPKYSHRRYLIAAVVILLFITYALALIVISHMQKPDPVNQAYFRQKAAKILRKDPNELTEEDFTKIIELSCVDTIKTNQIWVTKINQLSDIKTIEKFTNLEELDLRMMYPPEHRFPKWMNFLSKSGIYDYNKRFTLDLRPLGKLTKLREIHLGGSSIKHIKPLANLSNLEYLRLMDTPVCDLKPISKLPNLECLDIKNTEIEDLEPIKGLVKLKLFYISNCKNISDKELDDLQKALPKLKIEKYK